MRADEATLHRVRAVLAEAMSKGADPAEALNKAGLLWFAQREAQHRGDALRRAAQVLDEMQVAQVAEVTNSRMPLTALDTKRVVVKWLGQIADTVT